MENTQNQKNQLPNIDNYVDVEGVSTKKLSLGLWYVEHMQQFRKGIIISLAAIGGIAWMYTAYSFGHYIFIGMKEDDLLAKNLAASGFISHNYFEQAAPEDLRTGSVHILKTGTEYDFAVQIENQNPRHWGEFDYFFVAGGKETKKESGFILPGEKKYLMALNQEAASQSAQLRIENIRWHRIITKEISDWKGFRDGRLNIKISDTQFDRQAETDSNALSFKVSNDTAYNYWNVNFPIVLFDGHGNVVSVNMYGVNEFMAGESKDIKIFWPGNLTQVSQILVVPEVNIMKDDVYMRFEGGVGEIK